VHLWFGSEGVDRSAVPHTVNHPPPPPPLPFNTLRAFHHTQKSGGLALPLHRDEPLPVLRPPQGLRPPPQPPRWYVDAKCRIKRRQLILMDAPAKGDVSGDLRVLIVEVHADLQAHTCTRTTTTTTTTTTTMIGTAVRFEPGETKTVPLVEIAGHKVIRGGAFLVAGGVGCTYLDVI
jgi:hypothetical protein